MKRKNVSFSFLNLHNLPKFHRRNVTLSVVHDVACQRSECAELSCFCR